MPLITLPDGSRREFEHPVSPLQVARSIGPGLARDTLAACVDDVLTDACDVITGDAALRLITTRESEGLEIIRHSCAHLLGQAVKQLYPAAQMVIGPVIEDGFYYDIAYEGSFSPEDLAAIEERMRELIAQEYDVVKKMTPREEALDIFRRRNESYKVRLVEEMPTEVQEVGLYHHQEYIDMCVGPHVPNTRFLKVFKLTRLSGAYWRGDASNEVLQRVYGTAWAQQRQLKEHLHRLEEAEKRDHRRLGARLGLFHFQEEAPGMVFWHPRGWTLYQLVEQHMRTAAAAGYQEVHTPQILERSLWERSGHWDKFGDMIFVTTSGKRDYAIKPMNCPAHVQIFNHELRSHHDLPLRLSEFGIVHRNEPSGTLHGLLRARRFTQDDGHIFCREEQLAGEIDNLVDLVFRIYADFGFHDILLAFSTRPENRVGEDSLWDRAEQSLQQVLEHRGLAYDLQPGEGAFYGPKIEFTLQDSIGRKWQCGTIQVDFAMPGQLGARYIAEDSSRHVPVMVHRAILGSLERFIGILLEHYAGALPAWLSPVQAVVLSITDQQAEHARQVGKELAALGARVEMDLRNEKIGLKIREHTMQKIPYMLIVGKREAAEGTIAVRTRAGEDLGAMTVASFHGLLREGERAAPTPPSAEMGGKQD